MLPRRIAESGDWNWFSFLRNAGDASTEKCVGLGQPTDKRLDLALPHPRQAPRPTAATAAQSHFDLIEIRGAEAHCLTVRQAFCALIILPLSHSGQH